jgi:Uma2 family endonuclease
MSDRGIEGAPTLVVEVVSPSSAGIDRRRKFQLYARYAVPYYWIVDPPVRTIEAYQFAIGTYENAGVLSGTTTASLPPFLDLTLDPLGIWPQ